MLNSRALGRVFKMDPDCLYLVSENGNVELPDEHGLIDVDCMDDSLVWSCEWSSPQRTCPRDAIRRRVPPMCESAWIKIIHVCDFDGLVLRKLYHHMNDFYRRIVSPCVETNLSCFVKGPNHKHWRW